MSGRPPGAVGVPAMPAWGRGRESAATPLGTPGAAGWGPGQGAAGVSGQSWERRLGGRSLTGTGRDRKGVFRSAAARGSESFPVLESP